MARMNNCSTTNYLIDTARMFEYPHREFFNSSQMRLVAAIDSTKESLVAVRGRRGRKKGRRKKPTPTRNGVEVMGGLCGKKEGTGPSIVELLPDSRTAR